MGASKRPFGVGLLLAGYDDLGPHLYQTSPNAEYFEYFVLALITANRHILSELNLNLQRLILKRTTSHSLHVTNTNTNIQRHSRRIDNAWIEGAQVQ
jgi:20S proteasome alpha/beta subunit